MTEHWCLVQPWVEDVVEQLALADVLHTNSEAFIRRIAFIVIDNGVEVALKTYVDFEKGISYFGISKKQWEQDYGRDFSKALQLVVSRSGANVNTKLVENYHNTRNDLYHKPKLLTIDAKDLKKYLKEARELANQLFALSFSENEWQKCASDARSALLPKLPPQTEVKTVHRDDGSISIQGIVPLPDMVAVGVVIQRYLNAMGRTPSTKELKSTLAASGKSPSNISDCVAKLRTRGMIKKRLLALTPKGQRKLAQYLV